MSVSRDRVRFTIPGSYLSRHSTGSEAYRKLIEECFGECLGRGDWNDVTIICRPSQFARFLIRRHQEGISNQFACLNAELFIPVEEKVQTVFDVSLNPNRVRIKTKD